MHAMAYDPDRDRLVLYAANPDSMDELPQTWEWDGDGWSMVNEGEPSPRVGAALVYDSARRRMLLIGGFTGFGLSQPVNEVWEWDGSEWSDVTPSLERSITNVQQTIATFDSKRNRTMLTTSSGEVWLGDFATKPAHLAAFSLDAMAPPERDIRPDQVTITARAGGSSTAQDAAQPGALLSLWDGYRWQRAACNTSDAGAPDKVSIVTRDPFVIQPMQVRNALRFAISPIANHGTGPLATVTTDYVEVRVRYHLGDAGAITPEPESGWEASGECPDVH
jgi:hypothetical protein